MLKRVITDLSLAMKPSAATLTIKSLMVNAVTVYRILAAPVLLILIWKNEYDLFKWLLVVSFFTDAIDGYLARYFKSNHVSHLHFQNCGRLTSRIFNSLFPFWPTFTNFVFPGHVYNRHWSDRGNYTYCNFAPVPL
jgi:hypothetical protein